jgi:hypothetical protein
MNNGKVNIATNNGIAYGRIAEDLLALTAGLGAGAGLMYLLDPERGRIRRGRFLSKASRIVRVDEHKVAKLGKDLLHRAQGIAHEAAASVIPQEDVPDEILMERIRSRMGHVLANPRDVQVHVHAGVVTLEGKLTHASTRRVRDVVMRIPGVREVQDHLTAPSLFGAGLAAGLAAGAALLTGKRNTAQTSKVAEQPS